MDSKIVLEHELVPKHEIMKSDEAAEVLKKYGIKKEKLPKIREKDPVVIAIGAKKNQILRITRKSPTAGTAEYFRLVI